MPVARAADGAALHWRETRGAEAADAADGAGPPTAVFLHGLGRDGAYFDHMPALLPRWRHLALDLRGFGRSPLPAPPAGSEDGGRGSAAEVSLRLWAEDVAAVLAAALCADAVLVVGHSLGAAVAVEFAASFPERVAALALAAPSARVGAAAAARWAAESAAAAARGEAGVAAAAAALSRGFDLGPQLRCLRRDMPVLLLAGADDRLTPPSAARRVAAELAADVTTLAVVAGAAHDALREAPDAQRALQLWARDRAEPALSTRRQRGPGAARL